MLRRYFFQNLSILNWFIRFYFNSSIVDFSDNVLVFFKGIFLVDFGFISFSHKLCVNIWNFPDLLELIPFIQRSVIVIGPLFGSSLLPRGFKRIHEHFFLYRTFYNFLLNFYRRTTFLLSNMGLNIFIRYFRDDSVMKIWLKMRVLLLLNLL